MIELIQQSLVHHQHLVAVHNCVQAMGYGQDRAICKTAPDCLLDEGIGSEREGFHELKVGQNCPNGLLTQGPH